MSIDHGDTNKILGGKRTYTVEEIAKIIGVDSLGFLSTDSVVKIAENAGCGFCSGCFTGKYPIDVPKDIPKDKFEMKFEE